MSDLPPPRRIILGHSPNGSPTEIDEQVPMIAVPGDFRVAPAFTQSTMVPDPTEAFDGAGVKQDGMFQKGGVAIRWVGKSFVLTL